MSGRWPTLHLPKILCGMDVQPLAVDRDVFLAACPQELTPQPGQAREKRSYGYLRMSSATSTGARNDQQKDFDPLRDATDNLQGQLDGSKRSVHEHPLHVDSIGVTCAFSQHGSEHPDCRRDWTYTAPESGPRAKPGTRPAGSNPTWCPARRWPCSTPHAVQRQPPPERSRMRGRPTPTTDQRYSSCAGPCSRARPINLQTLNH